AWYYGGALLISDAPAIVSSNVIVANTVGIGGNGGAAIIGGVGGPPPIEPPTFTGNIFFENNAGSGGAIGVFQSGPLPVFHDNYLVDDATYQVLVHDTPSIDTLDFSGNWWGTDDPAAIAARIYDSSDDPLLLWTVDFSGWCVDASCSGGVTGIYETEPQLETWSRIKNAYR
ncbi:MAG: hypothetical protein KAW67_02940, partial [Candidatus Eisenbacteria sp.]|nr:hypothetical protein [Candidatus Eisenbacteria bacterium]